MDYAQEQADELEALTSIFADDLEGRSHFKAARRRVLHLLLPPQRHLAHRQPHTTWLQRSGTASPWDGAPWDRCGEWW